jgi:outer membrane lipoprotein-sorting protein
MENHQNFHHDELLKRAVEAVLRDPIPDELPPDRVAQLAAVVRQAADQPYPTTLIERIARLLDTWRWIMRSPVFRVATAAVFVFAIAGVALWFHVSGTQYAFADFIKPILEAKSAKFKATFERDGKQVATADVMVLAPNRVREELRQPGRPVEIRIADYSKGVSILIDSAKKIAVINRMVGLPRGRASMNLLEEMRSLILDAKKPDVQRESLGEKEVDGHRAVGWRLSGPGLHEPGLTATIWGDPQTGLPIRMESYYALDGQKSTLSDCILNPDFDESIFNLDPPAGYKVLNKQTDLSPVTEKDLTETLRRCGEVYGAFPDTLNMQAIYEIGKRPPEKDGHKIDDLWPLAVRGFGFVVELPTEADAHYTGKGVSPGKAETPIFWYRPKDGKKYRVIYADLLVRDADTPPSVPNARPVSAQPSPKQ